MGVDTYTLRTKRQNILVDGEIVSAYFMGYLCKSMDHDTQFVYPGDPEYRRAHLLNAQLEAAQDRWAGKGPVYFMTENPRQGYEVHRAENPEKAAIQYDCDDPCEIEGVTLVGRLGERVRRGKLLVWTIMTPEEAEAFDTAERERNAKEQEAYRREAQRKRIRERVRALNERKRLEREASLDSSGL